MVDADVMRGLVGSRVEFVMPDYSQTSFKATLYYDIKRLPSFQLIGIDDGFGEKFDFAGVDPDTISLIRKAI